MKLKSNLLTAVIILLFLFTGKTIQAQCIYNNKSTKVEAKAESKQSTGGLFRNDDAPPGSGGNDGDPAPGDDDPIEPIGEGIMILSLLAGGYALLKKKFKEKV